MAKVTKKCLSVAFIDMEKAVDIVNRKRLFEVMRSYGVQGVQGVIVGNIQPGFLYAVDVCLCLIASN